MRQEQKLAFVRDYESGQWSMAELCERYGVTRPTGYKWVRRRRRGPGGPDRPESSAAGCPHRTPAHVEELILAAREEYGWGAKKLLPVLRTRHPRLVWPARSTVNEILERHGLLHKNRRRRKWIIPARPRLETERPTRSGPPTSKASSRRATGSYCYPADRDRSLQPHACWLCHGLPSVKTVGAKPVFGASSGGGAARRHSHRQRCAVRLDGHPRAVRRSTSGGCSSASCTSASRRRVRRRTARTSGCIASSSARRRGRRRATCVVSSESSISSASATTKSDRTKASTTRYPRRAGSRRRAPTRTRIAPPEYPGQMEMRRVSTAGTFRLKAAQPFLSHALRDQYIGARGDRRRSVEHRLLQDPARQNRRADRKDHGRLTTPKRCKGSTRTSVKDQPDRSTQGWLICLK